MSLTVVVPWIGPKRLLRECIKTMRIEDTSASLLVVNNSWQNLGIAASWNKGLDMGSDWTLILSAAMSFPTGLQETARQIEETNDYAVRIDEHSFHAIAISRRLVDKVGRFDEEFYPMEYEDSDYRYRMRLAGIQWEDLPTIETDLVCAGNTIAGKEGYVPKSDEPVTRYLAKWGGHPGAEKFKTPFNE